MHPYSPLQVRYQVRTGPSVRSALQDGPALPPFERIWRSAPAVATPNWANRWEGHKQLTAAAIFLLHGPNFLRPRVSTPQWLIIFLTISLLPVLHGVSPRFRLSLNHSCHGDALSSGHLQCWVPALLHRLHSRVLLSDHDRSHPATLPQGNLQYIPH